LSIWKKVVGILTAGLVIYFSSQFIYASTTKKSKIIRFTPVTKRSDRVVLKGLRISESLGDRLFFDWKKNRLLAYNEYRFIYGQQTIMRKKLDTNIFLSSL
jgi:hypothetical protein